MILDNAQIRYLKKLAHHLKPLVQLGKKGLTDSLVSAIGRELDSHELIKIKFTDFKDERDALSERIVDLTGGSRVTRIGNVLVLYRRNPDPEKRKIALPAPKGGADGKQ